MNLFAISGLSCGIACLILSAITLYFGKTKLHRQLMFFNIVVAVWGFGLFAVGTAGSWSEALYAWKIAYVGGFFVGPSFYHFVSVFTNINRRKLLVFAYAQASIFSLTMIGTELLINSPRSAYGIYYHGLNTIFVTGFSFYIIFVILSFIELITFLRSTQGYRHKQAKYITYSFMAGFLGATSAFLPLFGIEILYPAGNFGITAYVIVVTFAILRHRLLNLNIVIRKSLIYSVSAAVLTGIFIILVLTLTTLLSDYAHISSIPITAISALIIAFLFTPLKEKVQCYIDRVFYKTTYDYYSAVQNVSHELASTIDLKYILRLIVDTFFTTLQLKSAYILSSENDRFETVCFRIRTDRQHENNNPASSANRSGSAASRLNRNAEIMNLIKSGNDIIIRKDLTEKLPKDRAALIGEELNPLEGEVVVPIFIDRELHFLLILGEKLSGDMFSGDDINLLRTIRNQAAISLKNAGLYEELERRVEERTAELSESNHSLQKEIKERMQAEAGLLNEKFFSDSVINSLPGIFYLFDKDGQFLRWNHNFEKVTGVTSEEMKTKHPLDFFDSDEQLMVKSKIQGVFVTGSASVEAHLLSRSREKVPYHFTGFRMDMDNEHLLVGVGLDMSEQKKAEEKIKYLAYYDSLTGLPNRDLFRDRAGQSLKLSSRYDRMLAVLFIDLDNFKKVNDTLGHHIGDWLLKKVSLLLQRCLRDSDTVSRNEMENVVSRQGGDEFTILLTEVVQSGDAGKVADRLLNLLSRPIVLGKDELFITASIGIALYPFDGLDLKTLLQNADTAMYHAKEQGKNNYQYYRQSMHDQVSEKMTLENHLRKALEREEFILCYQPQVDAVTGKIIGLEALVRWQSPDMGMVSPAKFIPLAEESGLIVPIGEWVINAACAQNKAWQTEGLPMIPVSVNMASRQFQRIKIINEVALALEQSGLQSQYLMLEITESALMEETEASFASMHELTKMGIRFIMDDFGTGYSSLSYLKRFPLHAIKIDRSFVNDITTDSDDAAIAEAIISIAHSLNMKVVAEGVETEEQLAFLRDRGCDEFQGYLLCKPLLMEEISELLAQEKESEGLYASLMERHRNQVRT